MTITDVIARLEAGETGREMDVEIACLILDAETVPDVDRPGILRDCAGTYKAPDYTTSLDAALTLVPEGYARIHYSHGRDDQPTCELYVPGPPHRGIRHRGVAFSEPAAICIAALRAREAGE